MARQSPPAYRLAPNFGANWLGFKLLSCGASMRILQAFAVCGALLLSGADGMSTVAFAQETAAAKPFKTEQLDQMLAPIALYPDDLLTNVLTAATYPLEVVQAARWRKEPANAKLSGDGLAKALEAKDWDPSVKALTQVPDVLQMMNEKLEWTQKLGDAFLAQQADVMGRIQFLRKKADEAGTLKSNSQQVVTKQETYIVIAPAKPNVIYVPVYQPTVVYGTWWYPTYPPYYYYYGRPASAFVSGFFWGTGVAVASSVWGWGRCDWGRNDIDIDINRYNNINVNRTQITSNTWKHDPQHRGSVPYRDSASREKYAKNGKLKDAKSDFRGFDGAKPGDKVSDKLGDGAGSKIKDRAGGDASNKIKDRVGDDAGGKVKDRVNDGGGAKVKDRVEAGSGAKTKDKVRDAAPAAKAKVPATRDVKKPAATKPAKALDVKPAASVQKHADRGASSRAAAASHSAGRAGGANRGGGGRAGGGRNR